METKSSTARIPQRIAAELGVPVASFFDQAEASSPDSEAMPKAVAALLSAYTAYASGEGRLVSWPVEAEVIGVILGP